MISLIAHIPAKSGNFRLPNGAPAKLVVGVSADRDVPTLVDFIWEVASPNAEIAVGAVNPFVALPEVLASFCGEASSLVVAGKDVLLARSRTAVAHVLTTWDSEALAIAFGGESTSRVSYAGLKSDPSCLRASGVAEEYLSQDVVPDPLMIFAKGHLSVEVFTSMRTAFDLIGVVRSLALPHL